MSTSRGDGPDPTRRDFLRRTGIGAAGLAAAGTAIGLGIHASGAGRQADPAATPLPTRATPGFDHHVVVMFENRSFDNVLGRLYGAHERNAAGGDGRFRPRDAPGPLDARALLSWRISYDATQLISLTGFMHAPALERYWKTNFRDMSQFYDDAREGNLPAYSFIEPRMVFNHNDMHPPWSELRQGSITLDDGTPLEIESSAYSDARASDRLVQDIYDAIRTSASPRGSNAMNTTLVITFDEHGGTFDHVAPPAAVPPHPGAAAGEMGFAFDRLGPRVPAIVVGAHTPEGAVLHEQMHHGAVITTLCRRYGLAPLTERDAGANPIFSATSHATPRHPSTWPTPQALWMPPNPEAVAAHTYGEAYDALTRYGEGLFGTRDETVS